MLTQERQIMLPCRLEHTSSWRLGEGVGGEPGDGSQNMEGVLCSVTTYTMTLNKSISFSPPTNEFIYLWIKKKGGGFGILQLWNFIILGIKWEPHLDYYDLNL